MARKSIKFTKKTAIQLLLILVVGFFVIEAGVRCYEKLFFHIPFFKSLKDYHEPLLGWKGKEIWGDPATKKFKIFIIGDSFTDGMGIPEKSMYYAGLKNEFDAELFVYGGTGYGTLQQYLVLKRYYNQIRPDLIILQVCSNDFLNNSWELERKSFLNNNQMVRPYWQDEGIKYRYPRWWGGLRVALSVNSRLFYRFFNQLEKLNAWLVKKHYFGMQTIEETIERQKSFEDLKATLKAADYADIKASLDTTDYLITQIKDAAASTPVIAFAANDQEPYLGAFRDIFAKKNIPFIDGVPWFIRRQEATGTKLIFENLHWNEKGHEMVGIFLTKELYRLGYYKKTLKSVNQTPALKI